MPKLTEEQREIHKAHAAYHRAECQLAALRDKLYPPGSKIYYPGTGKQLIEVVRQGSLYAHQIMTEWGHIAWQNLERVKDDDLPGGV